ncbi:hypothetical protein F4805DRAFT_461369 [Annulohypoxylon moriforme]|nr:hypothetical protein F4805DRAFT_461369 [Annulohypoxylon moriforme]
MSLRKVITPDMAPNTTRMRETADSQFGSLLFMLPLEIRDMVYAECWKVSGFKQHIFMRDDRLTHWPCKLPSDEVDERFYEFQRMLEAQNNQRRSHTRSLKLDERWARRFSSPWQNHWRCEEEMLTDEEAGFDHPSHPKRTLFLPILLACKRTYLEARPSIYPSLSPIFTSLAAAHAFLSLPPSTVSTQIGSLSLSLAVPVQTLHQHHQQLHLADPPGPWANLCTHLSNLVRFAALRDVTLRLTVDGTDETAGWLSPSDDKAGFRLKLAAGPRWRDVSSWPSVRERWALSAVRGLLARCLTVQLPVVTPLYRYPEWVLQHQYIEGDGRGMPFRKLERYRALPAIPLRKDERIKPRVDESSSPASSEGGGTGNETRLQRTRRSVRRLVGGR